MDAKKFSEAYLHPAARRSHPDKEWAAMFKDSFEWSDKFSRELHNVLQDGEPAGDTTANNVILSYSNWSQSGFLSLLDQVEDRGVEQEHDRYFAQTLGFHALNQSMLLIWRSVIAGKTSIPPNDAVITQNLLASVNVGFMEERREQIDALGFRAAQLTAYYKMRSGMMYEIDAAVTALETTKRHPEIAIVPAPAMFAAARDSSRKSDLIAIDLKQKQARGLEIKFRVDNELPKKTDRNYVTLIDGQTDLDDVMSIRPDPHQSLQIAVPWPGLISAHHLASAKNPQFVNEWGRKNLLEKNDFKTAVSLSQNARRSQIEAKKSLGGTRSSNKKAAQIVINRIMTDLYD